MAAGRLLAGGTPEATTGSATAETSVQGVAVRYVVTRPRVGCKVWLSQFGQTDQLTDLVDAAGVGLPGGVVVSDDYGQIPAFGLPVGLKVNGVWLDPTDTSDARFWLPVRVGGSDLEAAAPSAANVPDDYRLTASGGQAVWAPVPGVGASQVAADNIAGGSPSARAWTVGSRAQLRASSVVRAAGGLVTTTDGAVAVTDGATADRDLTLMLRGRDIADEAGIAAAFADTTGRAPLYILVDGTVVPVKIALPTGSVDTAQLTPAVSSLMLQATPTESGWALVAADPAGRVPFGIRADTGRTYAWGLDVGPGGITGATLTGGGGGTSTATGAVTNAGTAPNRTVTYTPARGGAVMPIGSGDVHDGALTPDGRVLFTVGSGAQQVTTPGSGLIVPATSTTDVFAAGDSITEGVGSGGSIGAYPQSWPAQLATLLGVNVQNEGVGGQVANMIAARQGSMRSTLTAAVTVPADTSTAVTMTLAMDPLWSGNLPRSRGVTIGGIPGMLVRNASPAGIGAAGGYSFTRTTAGTATVLPVGAPVVFDSEIAGRTRTQIWAGGRNDVRQGYGTAGVFTAAAAFWNDRDGGAVNYVRRKLITGITTQLGETAADLAAIMAYNAAQAATYGPNFLDIDAYLRTPQALADAGLTATSQDNADMAAGLICTQLHSPDGLHFTATAYALFAQRIRARFVTLGWSS